MKTKRTITCLLIAGLTTVTLASTAQAAPVPTRATTTATAPSLAAFVPSKKDRPFVLLSGKKNKPAARWYPCKPITWGIIAKGIQAGEIPRLQAAFDILSAATGLKFKYKGVSKKSGKSPKYHAPSIPGADIAIKFEDFTKTFPKHADVAAYGGAQYPAYYSQIGRYEYGYVRVDTPDLPAIPEPVRQTLYLHELGHVVGLDHAPGPNVMNPTVSADIPTYSAGDLAGLKVVGRHAGDCKSGSPFN